MDWSFDVREILKLKRKVRNENLWTVDDIMNLRLGSWLRFREAVVYFDKMRPFYGSNVFYE